MDPGYERSPSEGFLLLDHEDLGNLREDLVDVMADHRLPMKDNQDASTSETTAEQLSLSFRQRKDYWYKDLGTRDFLSPRLSPGGD